MLRVMILQVYYNKNRVYMGWYPLYTLYVILTAKLGGYAVQQPSIHSPK